MDLDNNEKETNVMSAVKQKIKIPSVNTKGTLYNYLLNGVIIWVIIFVLAEIIISGGRYEKDLYLFVTLLIISLAILIYTWVKRKTDGIAPNIVRGLATAIPVALFDYLAVNLLLEKNSYTIYKFWGYYAIYGLVLIFPIAAFLVDRYILNRLSSIDKP